MSIFGSLRDGVSVRVSAETARFNRQMDRAERSVRDFGSTAIATTGPLQAIQGRADEAGDEIADVGRESGQASRRMLGLAGAAGATAGSFGALGLTTDGLSFSFGSLTSSLTGTVALLGLVGTAAAGLLSTLVPLAAVVGTMTAGLGALAGAFGAVIGSGILAFGRKRGQQNAKRLRQVRDQIDQLEDLQETEAGLTDAQEEELDVLEEVEGELEDQTGVVGGLESALTDLRDELVPIIADFGEQFLPLIEDAIDAIPDLVENVLDAMGGFDRFTDALRDFGRIAFDVLPDLFGWMVMIAEMALPPMRDLLGWILQNGADVFRGMLRTTRRLAPLFLGLLDAIIDVVPEINELGTRILEVAVPALSKLIDFVEDVVQLGLESDSFVGFIRNAIDALVEWIQGPGKKEIQGVIQSIKDTFAALLGGDEGESLLSAFTGFVSGVLEDVASWMEGGGQTKIQNTLTSLFGAMADVLTGSSDTFESKIFTPLQTILSGLFNSITAALQSDEAGRLGTAIGNTAGAIMRLFADELIEYARSPDFTEDLKGLTLAVSNSVGRALISGGRRALGIEEGEGLGAQTGFGARTVEPNEPLPVDRTSERFWRDLGLLDGNRTGGANQPAGREVVEHRQVIEFRGEGEITQVLAQLANEQVDRVRSATERRAGRPSGL